MQPVLNFLLRFNHETRNDCAYAIEKPVKVAIIDDGVAVDLFTDIEGQSFIENGLKSLGESHWHTVTNTHGTQMAHLIDKMNKFRRLFVAKICQHQHSVDVRAAEEVGKRSL